MAKKRPNMIEVDRDEYASMKALAEETYPLLALERAKLVNERADLVCTINAQTERLKLLELRCMGLERLTALRHEAVLADGVRVVVHARHRKPTEPTVLADVVKAIRGVETVELFDDEERISILDVVVDRAQPESTRPQTAGELQEHIIRRLRAENARLSARLAAAELDLSPTKAGSVTS